jgi:hypothetical protein
MVALILGLLFCVGVAMVVVGLVAVPARRQGRDVLTPKGEQVLTRVLEKGATDDEAPRTGTSPAAPPSGLAG